MDDTLWTIAARQYCLNEWPALYYARRVLARYNRFEFGSDPYKSHPGTVICPPAWVESGRWHADRSSTGESTAPATPVTRCGNGRREEQGICDGEELGVLTCETLGLPQGRLACRIDCKGFEVAACLQAGGQKTSAAPSESALRPPAAAPAPAVPGVKEANRASPRSKTPLVVPLGVEVLDGLSLPLSSELQDYMYRLVGMVGAGIRVRVGWAEVAPRGMFLYGKGRTIFNDREQEQRAISGGLLVQGGVPFDFQCAAGHAWARSRVALCELRHCAERRCSQGSAAQPEQSIY
jgi:hypothetical protein